jgi:hypothetical protein
MVEDISVKNNGSGTYKFSVNLSQSKTQIDKIKTQDSILNFKVPSTSDLDKKLEEVKVKLGSIEGISNVQSKSDHVNYIYNIQCDFANVHQLNKAIQVIWKNYDKSAPESFNLYSYENGVFKRNSDISHIEHVVAKAGNQEVDMCRKATYMVICRFEQPITEQTSNYYVLSPSKKAAMYKNDLWTTISYKQASNNIIKITQ